MQKLTLTGATLVQARGSVEMAPSHHGHDHGGHDHGHDHGHNHEHSGNGGGCCAPKPAPVRVVYTPPSDEDLKKATAEEIRTSLCTLIRLGGFQDAFEPLLNLILEKCPTAEDDVLDTNGEDSYSLLHWAAKRG